MEAQTIIPLSDFNKANFKDTVTFFLNHNNSNSSMMRVAGNNSSSMTGIPVQFPNHYGLPNECQIFEDGKQRIIRYAIGEKSIYKDEQSDDTKVPKKKQKISFANGILNVKKYETQLLEYLRKSNWNGSNKNRIPDLAPLFYEYNATLGAKELIQKASLKNKAAEWCFNADWIDIKSYAMVLQIDIDRDPEEVKWELSVVAERDPAKFMEGLKNKSTQRKYIILEAIRMGVLTYNQRASQITWKDGNPICQSPIGKDPIDHLVGLTFNDTNGEILFEGIKDAVTPKIKDAPEHKPKEDSEKYKLTIDTKPVEDLIAKAVATGVFTKAGPWINYKKGMKWMGRAAIPAIAGDENLRNEILADIKAKEVPV